MRRYEDREREVVLSCECVFLRCDVCGQVADYPKEGMFLWGGVGRAIGSIEWNYYIDGEDSPEHLDLCYECAEDVAKVIGTRSAALLQLIGRKQIPAAAKKRDESETETAAKRGAMETELKRLYPGTLGERSGQ